jgi:hypothetical protein
MSKYKDLCKIYTNSRMKFSRHQDDCHQFLESLIQGLVKAFDTPEDKIKLVPVIGEPDASIIYSVREAMRLTPDKFWHIGVEITLVCQTCVTDPVQPIMINLGVMKEGRFFLLTTDPGKDPFKVSETKHEELKIFYDELFERIKELLEKSTDTLLEKEHTVCKIGFKSDCK